MLSFGNTLSVTAARSEVKGLLVVDSVKRDTVQRPASYFQELFNRTGQSYSQAQNLNGATYGNTFRVGYLLGLQYQQGRLSGEISVQQYLSGLSSIDVADVKNIYSRPYFRLGLGYQLWSPRRRR